MAPLPTPPSTPTPDSLPDHAILTLELDSLLERYLYLLDQHQTLHAQLSKQLSQGFFSLAQANFAAPGRGRYGQDHYDERMKAGRRISIQVCDEDAGTYTFRATSPSNSSPAQLDRKEPVEKQERTSQTDLVAKAENVLTSPSINESKSKQRDPLKWFGILVPPALRSAQSSFVSAADDSVPSLATIMAEMRDVEGEVEHVRSKIESLE